MLLRRGNVAMTYGWIQSMSFNFLEKNRQKKRKKRNRISERMNYEGVGYNVESSANCVVGQLKSLVFRYKMFKLSLKWTELDRTGWMDGSELN